MNPSEEYVSKLCSKSFLSLWSYKNPQGKDSNKELCDILVICEPDVIIFSVKNIALDEKNIERWLRKAIDESAKQIYGAERYIDNSTCVVTKEREIGLNFPSKESRRVHRIAVAFGSKDKIPYSEGDFGKGFVHVFDERTLDIIMNELDTIIDFTEYLIAKENLVKKVSKMIVCSEDLLAIYLANAHTFPELKANFLIAVDNSWDHFVQTKEYINKKDSDKNSYIWDILIEIFCQDFKKDNMLYGGTLTEVEEVTRTMARENRFNRRFLGKVFEEFVYNSKHKGIRSRLVKSTSDTVYVFLCTDRSENREVRKSELGLRCFIARGKFRKSHKVIGIATEYPETEKGFSLDAIFLYKEDWTEEDQLKAEEFQEKFKFFNNLKVSHHEEDEYPK